MIIFHWDNSLPPQLTCICATSVKAPSSDFLPNASHARDLQVWEGLISLDPMPTSQHSATYSHLLLNTATMAAGATGTYVTLLTMLPLWSAPSDFSHVPPVQATVQETPVLL